MLTCNLVALLELFIGEKKRNVILDCCLNKKSSNHVYYLAIATAYILFVVIMRE